MRASMVVSGVVSVLLVLVMLLIMASSASAEEAGTLLVVVQSGVTGIVRVNPTTGTAIVVTDAGTSNAPDHVAIGPNGDLFLIDQDCCGGGGALFRVNPSTGAQTIVSSGGNFVNPAGLAIAADGQIFVCDSSNIIRVDPNSGGQTVISSGGNLFDVIDVALGPDGFLYAKNANPIFAIIVRIDPLTGAQTSLPNDPRYGTPISIAVAGDGQLYLADLTCCGGAGGVFRVNPTTGAATLIASGGLINRASGVAVGAGGEVYVTNDAPGPGNAHVVRVDPTTGIQQVVDASSSYSRALGVTVVPGLSVADASATEGNDGTTIEQFGVSLAPWSPLAFDVPFATVDGTAHANSDYGSTSGTLHFAPGDTTKTIRVPIVGDRLSEPTETFGVQLTAPPPVGLARGLGTGTILDDDGTATLSVADAAVVEGNSGTTTLTFPVTLGPASGQVVTVQYATADGSARAPGDYQSTQGTVTFQPGQTSASIVVPVVGDAVFEADETLTVSLTNPTGGAGLGRAQATGTILNDDPAQACTPRPHVLTTPVAGGGALQVNVSATPLNTQQNNPLVQIRFGQLQNAQVTLNGQQISSGQVVVTPLNTFAASFTVRRVTVGEATMVPFTVVDGCGDWPTFVGGGTGAGF